MKKEVREEERGSACKRTLSWKKGIEVTDKQIESCREEKSMRVRMSEKEMMFHPADTTFFRSLEGKVRQRVLRASTD